MATPFAVLRYVSARPNRSLIQLFYVLDSRVHVWTTTNASFALEIGYFGERSERPSERQRASFPLNMRLKRLALKKFRLLRQLFQGCALAAAFGCSIAAGSSDFAALRAAC